MSGNVALASSMGVLSKNLSSVNHIVFEGKAVRAKTSRIFTGGVPAHGRWIFGSSHVPSTVEYMHVNSILYLILGAGTLVKCTEQVKETSLNGRQDGLLAIIDGNGSPDVPHILQSLLTSTLSDELKQSPCEENGMLYLEHTFLTLHRYSSICTVFMMGRKPQKYNTTVSYHIYFKITISTGYFLRYFHESDTIYSYEVHN